MGEDVTFCYITPPGAIKTLMETMRKNRVKSLLAIYQYMMISRDVMDLYGPTLSDKPKISDWTWFLLFDIKRKVFLT